jgi:hypothetical protein
MHKKDFVQRILIRSLPKGEKISDGIDYAESMWQALSERGYGCVEKQAERDVIDHYKKLTVFQKEHFDNFWIAFGLKTDRNGAAQSWLKLGELSEPEYLQIVKAAKAERAKPREANTTRKMAQGWLSGRRFDDYTDKKATVNHKTNPRMQEISGELTTLRRFESSSPGEYTEQISVLEFELSQLARACKGEM